MSYYYKYKFISPEGIYAIIKEEFKSYFDTGAIDDLLFNTYTDKCLKKLGKSSYNIIPYILNIKDFNARLPENFHAVREAWMCSIFHSGDIKSPNSFYSPSGISETIKVSSNSFDSCNEETEEVPFIDPETMIVYKTNSTHNQTYTRQYLLKPGNISVQSNFSLDCANFGVSAVDSFDIRDNKFFTNFREGYVYLLMYANDEDCNGNQMIPDNYRITEYIEAFIKFKMFETLVNQVNDETFNQLQQKMIYYKSEADTAYILAESEIKKQDVYTKVKRIAQQARRFSAFKITNRRY
jgi:hypothetical protein